MPEVILTIRTLAYVGNTPALWPQQLTVAYLEHLMCLSPSLWQVLVENIHVHGITIHILWHIKFLKQRTAAFRMHIIILL